MFPKFFHFSQFGIYILKIHHSKRDLDYIIPKNNYPDLIFKSQIYILEKEMRSSRTIFVV
jgi:hypothetical protein